MTILVWQKRVSATVAYRDLKRQSYVTVCPIRIFLKTFKENSEKFGNFLENFGKYLFSATAFFIDYFRLFPKFSEFLRFFTSVRALKRLALMFYPRFCRRRFHTSTDYPHTRARVFWKAERTSLLSRLQMTTEKSKLLRSPSRTQSYKERCCCRRLRCSVALAHL